MLTTAHHVIKYLLQANFVSWGRNKLAVTKQSGQQKDIIYPLQPTVEFN